MTAPHRAANVLGALALVVTDRVGAVVAAEAGGSLTSAAALSALHHFLRRPTIDDLRRVLGLTPSGAVRLVDRLATTGLVAREAGGDGRSRAVVLTEAGRTAAERISAARGALLADLLADLSPAEQDALHDLLSRVMAALARRKEGDAWICRLCDLDACGRPAGACPAANAAAAKYGPSRATKIGTFQTPRAY